MNLRSIVQGAGTLVTLGGAFVAAGCGDGPGVKPHNENFDANVYIDSKPVMDEGQSSTDGSSALAEQLQEATNGMQELREAFDTYRTQSQEEFDRRFQAQREVITDLREDNAELEETFERTYTELQELKTQRPTPSQQIATSDNSVLRSDIQGNADSIRNLREDHQETKSQLEALRRQTFDEKQQRIACGLEKATTHHYINKSYGTNPQSEGLKIRRLDNGRQDVITYATSGPECFKWCIDFCKREIPKGMEYLDGHPVFDLVDQAGVKKTNYKNDDQLRRSISFFVNDTLVVDPNKTEIVDGYTAFDKLEVAPESRDAAFVKAYADVQAYLNNDNTAIAQLNYTEGGINQRMWVIQIEDSTANMMHERGLHTIQYGSEHFVPVDTSTGNIREVPESLGNCGTFSLTFAAPQPKE